jgi:hypothetical protein
MRIDNIVIEGKRITQGAAGGGWKDFVPGANISNLPGSWSIARYKRNLENIDLFLTYTASGAATGAISILANDLLSSLGLTTNQQSMTIPGAVGYNFTGSVFFNGVWNPITGGFRGPNISTWTTTVPFTWATGSQINIIISLQISQWTGSGTVGLVENYEEYASNNGGEGVTPGSTYTNTSYCTNDPGGSLIPNITTNSTVQVYTDYIVTFPTDIQPNDDIAIEVMLAGDNSWRKVEELFPRALQNAGRYGMYRSIAAQPANKKALLISFGGSGPVANGATYGVVATVTWSTYNGTGTKWRVRKTSAGKPGQELPTVRAEVENSSARSGSAYLLFSSKIEDTNSCFSTATGVFTPCIGGLLRIFGNVLNSTTATCTLYVVVKRGGITVRTKIAGETRVASSRIIFNTSVRVQAGDEVALYCDQGTAASATAGVTFELGGI